MVVYFGRKPRAEIVLVLREKKNAFGGQGATTLALASHCQRCS
jgi:hypothetical protein